VRTILFPLKKFVKPIIVATGGMMNFHTEYIWFNTKKKRELINITPDVETAVQKSGIGGGQWC